jgi:hypothetical protein
VSDVEGVLLKITDNLAKFHPRKTKLIHLLKTSLEFENRKHHFESAEDANVADNYFSRVEKHK